MYYVTKMAFQSSVRGEEDFQDFCRTEFPRLVGALTLYLGSNDAAEELAQEALVRAFQRWKRIRAMDNPGAWVHHVALNLATSHWRRARAERRARARLAEGRETSSLDSLVDVAAVRAEVKELPRAERTILILRFFVELSVAEVSEVTGRPEGTVKRLTHEAITRLRKSGVLDEFKEGFRVSN